MDKEEILEQLLANFTAVSKVQNSQEAYKITGHIFNLLRKLEPLDKSLAEKISKITASISSSADLEEIQNYANIILKELAEVQKSEKRFIPKLRIAWSKEYKRDIERYQHIKSQILETERAIILSPSFQKKLHEPIKRGKYKGCPHARLTDNMRIIYVVDYAQNKLVYITILTKNDFENSFRIKPLNWIEKYKEL